MNTTLTLILGIAIRIGIPLTVTLFVFYLLRKLDQRWQKEGMAAPSVPAHQPCYEIKGCSEEKRKNCKAAANLNQPCWQFYRTSNGLKEECLGCEVFRLSPVPQLS
jgi:hypothetical protein